MTFQTLKTCLKREYWEYKLTFYLVPVILSVFIFLAALAAEMYVGHLHEWALEQADIEMSIDDDEVEQEMREEGDRRDRGREITIDLGKSPVQFLSIYLSLAWFVGLYYLLSALYTDRRENSILYWKSMPVSESTNVASKLLFGTLGFVAIALVAGWAMYLLLELLGWGGMKTNSDGTVVRIDQDLQPLKLFLWPLHGILAGVLWGAPVFGYFMLISAFAKRARFLWLIVPLVCLSVIEGILLRSRNSTDFLLSHLPHVALERLQGSASLSDFWQQVFGPMLPSMVIGWVLAAAFVAIAIWCRNNRFEV